MASKPSWQYYEKLGDMSRVRALAESIFNTRSANSPPTVITAAQAYEISCQMPWVNITDLPIYDGAIKSLGLKPGSKVLNDNHGGTVGRSAEARVFYNRISKSEQNDLELLLREAIYELQCNHDLVIAEGVIGTHPDMMLKARLLAPVEDAMNMFNWMANFQPLHMIPEYESSKLHDIPDILFVAYPEWVSDDPRWARGCVVVDERHMTIFNLGLRYFGERKKGTLTMAWTAGMRLGAVAAHGSIKEIDFSECEGYEDRGKQVIAFYGLSGSGKSSHSNSLDNEGTLPKGFKRRIAHDDAFQIDYRNKKCYVWEPSLFDKTDSRELDHPDWNYCISTQNMMVAEVDGKILPYGRDTRNNNGRAIFGRELLGETTNVIGFPNALGWLMKDTTLPPVLKIASLDLSVAMGATLMTKRTAAENVSEEEMAKLVFIPFANPFRVYELYRDCEGYEEIFKSGCECYVWTGGGFGFWNSSDKDTRPIPLKTSLTLQTAILTGVLEWEDWDLIPKAQIPTKETVDKILPGYYDLYNPATVENRGKYLATLKDRFQQRIDFLKGTTVANKPDLLARLIKALEI
ncbi:MAG: phosphoenolpyruvate carboxykinase (ATP) [Deltaproteobacteria bacterium]|nr:phosphoenolpyruvate carboxykinase (ATP) [Deltaproteobacteria bacterium]MBW2052262.1 phosphoenolpyruvate carboxykinase (ATP) [Deltaproteobacteria bacterium]MBW2141131.1 phosphoenolpyruvate carboxykinase (ATP) [Deltaproteobacteria bacterium]MBW2323083.1 phosphoenolpyruvate carboxykinase (ATP) [Deltaproteobacteria bacterium]